MFPRTFGRLRWFKNAVLKCNVMVWYVCLLPTMACLELELLAKVFYDANIGFFNKTAEWIETYRIA